MSLYDLPQSWETEETVALLMQLSTTQRRAVRAYISQVELGDMNVLQWLDSDLCPVSKGAWYRDGQRNYLNSPQFKAALDACLRRALLAQSSEEEKAIRQATRKLRLLVPKAVDSLETIMQTGESDAVKLRAADSILNRAGMETAEKSSSETVGMTLEEWRTKQRERQHKASQALDDFSDEAE
jgi:hypothetical protein